MTLSAEQEQHLIEQSLAGEVRAFNQLVEVYQGMAFSVAYRLLQDGDSAADALQDSFVKAFRALESFRGGSFKSWLMRIVTNTCYDMLRANKRRPTESLDDLPVDQDHATQLIDPNASPEDEVERGELQALIGIAINALPDDQRLALILCDVEGYAYDEIVHITGATMGTVKSRISRARGRVRDLLLASRSELLPAAYRPMGND